jgi:glycosyltransferase involved in cell wall biosynthesis
MFKLKYPILFITRTYPPVIGGMETLSYHTIKTMADLTKIYAIKNPYGKKALPFFVVWAFFKAIIILLFKDVKIIHLSDGVLAPAGVILRWIFPRVRVVSTIHGLDVAYAEQLPLYRYTNLWAIRRLDRIIAVSQEVKETCLKYGIPAEIITVIPNGTDADAFFDPGIKKNKIDEKIKDNFVILSLGRIVKRKGLTWFIRNVMPGLSRRVLLVIGSSGPDSERAKKAVIEQKLEDRIFFLGFVDDKEKKFLFNACDLFIMPNIKVKGDREGFGITVIEAASCELVPIVADLEGLRDAVKDRENGIRLPPKDSKMFIAAIKYLMDNPEGRIKLGGKARRYVKKNFDWSVIGRKYLEEFRKLEEI